MEPPPPVAPSSALLTAMEEIVALSRLEAGHIALADVAFSLRDWMAGATGEIAAPARAKGIELTARLDGGLPPTVCGDGARLRQVLVNLLANAVEFTPSGEVGVRVTADAVTDRGVDLRVEVADSGGGIDEESLPHIFDSYSPDTGSTSRRSGVTGLGLGIAKRVIELMGGRIGVRSTAAGSTLWFTVSLGVRAAGLEAGLAGERVLIVVDEQATNRAILERQLACWGMLGDTAADPGEALVALHTAARSPSPYRLVVFDTELPQMSGLDLAAAIRATPLLGRVALLMLTDSAPGRALAADVGIDGFLIKPVSQATLREEVSRVLAEAEAEAGAGGAPTAGDSGTGRWSKGTVLLAEDDSVNQLVAVRQLERRGFRVDLAANGREAVAMHARGSYQLILMDCQMPELDGYQATGDIRRREGPAQHTPIIALTADTGEGARERCLDAGMDDYLSKPVRSDHLDEALSRALGPLYRRPRQAHRAPEGGSIEGAPPILDGRVLAEICEGDDQLYARLAGMFAQQSRPAVVELARALTAGDADAAQRTAHALKGSSAAMGARQLSTIAGQICESAAAGRLPAAILGQAELEAAYERTVTVLASLAARRANQWETSEDPVGV